MFITIPRVFRIYLWQAFALRTFSTRENFATRVYVCVFVHDILISAGQIEEKKKRSAIKIQQTLRKFWYFTLSLTSIHIYALQILKKWTEIYKPGKYN